ncbi:MAG: bifunctional GNAT family N-acetyltransferase/GrpB family protein [Caldilinea sp.]|nr:GNAT family N-acetyltransferase [Caldilinea sp.]MCB9117765.1 GNAT family N-acetyltransferase [Caldilineaceae bacterium]MCB9121343.1 GNAT family N-acetyltransferase [Caldilineaceae bacterium]MCO5210751.1 bifunctional GNAT family N-acetyltransferase/GrpB family protein [Caldilinea sp.]
MPELMVRAATTADISVLLALIHESFEGYRGRLDPPSGAHAETTASLAALFDRGERAVLAAMDGSAAGCAFYVQTGVEMYLHRLAVLPALRRAGVGQALVANVVAEAAASDCAYLRVGVRLALPENIAFFERQGFVKIAEACHPGYAAPTFVHMTRELGPQMLRVIEVVPYDPAWPARFEAEAAAIRAALGDTLVGIEHIGSTSVPGLAAKPIIDMIPLVRDVTELDDKIGAMAAIGYTPRGEYGLPGRRYFRKGSAYARVVHAHAYQIDDPEAARHLAFRDYLRTHAEARAAYAELKIELAERHPTDIVAYMDGKDGLIKQLEAEALVWYRSGGKATA